MDIYAKLTFLVVLVIEALCYFNKDKIKNDNMLYIILFEILLLNLLLVYININKKIQKASAKMHNLINSYNQIRQQLDQDPAHSNSSINLF